jgi:A/G-specific adenine glycosylase
MIRDLPGFQHALVSWFERVGKAHPWRKTQDPYAVLVSELMLQQTTIAMVLARGHYQRWMAAFPTIEALAEADEAHVLRCWEGLGYYNRARNLQKAAKMVLHELGGKFPTTVEGLLALPGVGRYTAGAVTSFAYGQPAAIVDGNVARVLARVFNFAEEVDKPVGQRQLWAWAEAMVPTTGAREYNSGLMELGQTVCSVGEPACLLCPIKGWCQADEPHLLPCKAPRRQVVQVEEDRLVCRRKGKILMNQEQSRRRKGLWLLPLVGTREKGAFLSESRYAITHHRVTLRLWTGVAGDVETLPGEEWIPEEALPNHAMPSPIRRAMSDVWAAAATARDKERLAETREPSTGAR